VPLPAGASGPFGDEAAVLRPATPYSFRLCGGDQANPAPPVCAQTRTFTTATPEGDVAAGSAHYLGGRVTISFDAASGPDGEAASGRIYSGFDVTCLRVEGSEATIGGVHPGGGSPGSVLIWATEDPPGSGAGDIAFEVYDSTAPPDCSTPPEPRLSGPASGIVVWDTP
jgi:hypothetical protein